MLALLFFTLALPLALACFIVGAYLGNRAGRKQGRIAAVQAMRAFLAELDRRDADAAGDAEAVAD